MEGRFRRLTNALVLSRRWLVGELAKEARIEHNEPMMFAFFESVQAGNQRLLRKLERPRRPPFWARSLAPSGALYYLWSLLVTLAALYNLLTCSLGVFEEFVAYFGVWMKLNLLSDAANLLDILVQTRKGECAGRGRVRHAERIKEGIVLQSWAANAREYVRR